MALPTPKPDDPPESLYRQARALHEACEEKEAVLRRIKEHVGLWRHDKRMKVMGEVLLDQIARIEREERERRG